MSVGATWGKILHVDLTTAKIWTENPPDEIYLKLVGGRALEAYLLLRDLPVGADPLGPENLPDLRARRLPGHQPAGRGASQRGRQRARSRARSAARRRAAGGGMSSSAPAGMRWWSTASAESPVYLWIHNDKVEIRPADHLWGRDVADVEQSPSASELNEQKLARGAMRHRRRESGADGERHQRLTTGRRVAMGWAR